MNFDCNNKFKYAIWFYEKNIPLIEVTNEEKRWARDLSPLRAREYLLARGYLRKSISNIFDIDPLSIPLKAPPSKPPLLEDGLGFVSISHCNDALVLGWSEEKIGLDIEISNRICNYEVIIEKFFFNNEKEFLSRFERKKSNKLALSMWILKEAAIKWQNGNLHRDLPNWNISDDLLFNKFIDTKLKANLINYRSWIIGVVFEKKFHLNNPILCIN